MNRRSSFTELVFTLRLKASEEYSLGEGIRA